MGSQGIGQHKGLGVIRPQAQLLGRMEKDLTVVIVRLGKCTGPLLQGQELLGRGSCPPPCRLIVLCGQWC